MRKTQMSTTNLDSWWEFTRKKQ